MGASLALRRWELLWAPLLAAALALLAATIDLRGVDLPAQLYRVDLFHRDGLTLWDSQWYGGHWTLNYSVIFPPIAGTLGIPVTEILSASVAAWMFDRLVVGHIGGAARVGSLLFAVGTLAQVAIGQLPFLLGEALALSACWAATHRHWRAAVVLTVSASLASPLAGAFLALAAVAWTISAWPELRRQLGSMVAAALLPVLLLTVVFPGQGVMPFPLLDFICLLGLFVAAALLVPREQRTLRTGAWLYVGAIAASFVLPTSVGGNISRLGECLGAPLLVCLLWQRHRALLAIVAVPIAALQWGPTLATFTTNSADPSIRASYFQPMISYVQKHDELVGRVEVVPTKLHWEAAYVAPYLSLARGWERQLDTADNPIFYANATPTAAAYRAWLLDNGVRYVALPDAPLDYAARTEAHLLQAGVPGLRMVWRDDHWRVFAVTGAPGIITGPARLIRLEGSQLTLDSYGPGRVLVRLRYSALWRVTAGQGCLSQAPGGWTTVDTSFAGPITVSLGLTPAPSAGCTKS